MSRPSDSSENNKFVVPIQIPHPGDAADPAPQGELTAWFAEPGASLQKGDLLYQITWPGLAINYPVEVTGILKKRCLKLREQVSAGSRVAEIQPSETDFCP